MYSTLYCRHPKPRLDQRLMREGLKIFHACSEPLAAEEIARRSGLPIGTVGVFIQNLLEQGVLSIYESGTSAEAVAPFSKVAAPPELEPALSLVTLLTAETRPAARNALVPRTQLDTFKLELVKLLAPKLGRQSSVYLDTLEAAETAVALEQTARRLALKLKLTVDKQTGELLEQQLDTMFGGSA